MAQARNDEAADEGRIAEPHLGLGRVDVDIDFLGRDLQEQRQHRMAIARQHVGIGAAHRADQQTVLHRAAIDEQVLVIGHPAVEGRQARHPGEPRRSALQIDRHTILGQFARDDLGNAAGQSLARLYRQHPPSVMLEHEAHIGPGHRQSPDHIEAGGIFAARAAQELAPRRNLAEQVLDPDPGSRRQGCRPFLDQGAMIDHTPPALARRTGPAFQRQPGDTGNRRQRLAPEAEGRDQLDMIVGQFGGGVAFQRQCHFCRAHPAAVVGHFDPAEPTLGQAHSDAARVRIDRVFDQFLERRRRPFDHFARGNAVDQVLGQAANLRHGICLAAKRGNFETGSPGFAVNRHNFLAFRRGLR